MELGELLLQLVLLAFSFIFYVKRGVLQRSADEVNPGSGRKVGREVRLYSGHLFLRCLLGSVVTTLQILLGLTALRKMRTMNDQQLEQRNSRRGRRGLHGVNGVNGDEGEEEGEDADGANNGDLDGGGDRDGDGEGDDYGRGYEAIFEDLGDHLDLFDDHDDVDAAAALGESDDGVLGVLYDDLTFYNPRRRQRRRCNPFPTSPLSPLSPLSSRNGNANGERVGDSKQEEKNDDGTENDSQIVEESTSAPAPEVSIVIDPSSSSAIEMIQVGKNPGGCKEVEEGGDYFWPVIHDEKSNSGSAAEMEKAKSPAVEEREEGGEEEMASEATNGFDGEEEKRKDETERQQAGKEEHEVGEEEYEDIDGGGEAHSFEDTEVDEFPLSLTNNLGGAANNLGSGGGGGGGGRGGSRVGFGGADSADGDGNGGRGGLGGGMMVMLSTLRRGGGVSGLGRRGRGAGGGTLGVSADGRGELRN